MEQLANKTAENLDATRGFYLRSRIRHLLDRADQESHPKKRFALLENARELSRKLRRNDGNSVWIPLAFAFGMAAIFVAVLIIEAPKTYIYSAPDNYVHVLEQINEFDFVMQRVEKGAAQIPSVMHFCHDYKPLFEPGMTLTWFAFDDRGKCQSVMPANRGYILLRGSDYWPVLAPNCRQDLEHDHVVCDGKPKFN